MKNRAIIIITSTLFLFACKESTKTTSEVNQGNDITDSATVKTNRTIFLIDNCDNSNYSAALEEDKTKGNDSCILRINAVGKAIDKIEILNVPADRSSINYCEKEYVVVGFACGGPCYSQVFVFTDGRENKQFDYGQKISNNPNIIAHIRNEEFEKLIIHNLNNGKEQIVENPDINWMQYGQMDTMYIAGNTLKLEYQTVNKQTKKKSISLNDILK
jgi:hypothetical protein